MVWSVLPDGRMDFINRRWLDYSGLTLEQRAVFSLFELEGLTVSPRSLEDVYLELTGTVEGMGEEQDAAPAGGRSRRRGRRR